MGESVRGMDWAPEVWPPVECYQYLGGINGGDHPPQLIGQHFRHRHFHPHLTPGNLNVNVPLPPHPHMGSIEGTTEANASSGAPENLSQPMGDVLEESEEATDDEEEDEEEEEEEQNLSHPVQVLQQQDPLGVQGGPQMTESRGQHLLPIPLPIPPIQAEYSTHNSDPPNNNNNPPLMLTQPPPNDPNDHNSGFSLYGKMYFEDRIVLHLKQWSNHHLSSCAQQSQQHSPKIGCAVCRLKSPSSQDDLSSQKEAHRHQVRGVLFTFEDCIILEFYPEQPHQQQMDSNGGDKAIPSYLNPQPNNTLSPLQHSQSVITKQRPPLQQQPHEMALNELPSSTTHEKSVQQHPQDDGVHSWWDDFESNGHSQQQEQQQQDEEEEVEEDMGPKDSCCHAKITPGLSPTDYTFKSKCSTCSVGFLTDSQAQQHSCTIPNGHDLQIDLPPQDPEDEEEEGEEPKDDINIEEPAFDQDEVVEDGEEDSKQVKISSERRRRRRRRYKCPLEDCGRRFGIKKEVREHLEEDHGGENPLRCKKCGKQFTEGTGLKRHRCNNRSKRSLKVEKVVEEEPPMDMDEESEEEDENEGEEERAERDEQENVEENKTQENGIDVESDDGVNDEENLVLKSEGYSGSENELESSIQGPPKVKRCSKLGKDHPRDRKRRADRIAQCEKCGKRFQRRDKLMRHMFVHAEEKLFSCEDCGKKFSRRDKLSDHLKSHGTREEAHPCPKCQKEFLRPDILKQHVKLHTMHGKHQCGECLRFVTGSERLEKHMARHAEARALGLTLLCPLCTKYFIQRQSLKAHIKKFHPGSGIVVDLLPNTANSENSNSNSNSIPTPSNSTAKPPSEPSSSRSNGLKESSTNPKTFTCGVEGCGKKFGRKGALKKHGKVHTLENIDSKGPPNSPPVGNVQGLQNDLGMASLSSQHSLPHGHLLPQIHAHNGHLALTHHQLNMAAQSYVLAYPHYPYQ